MRLMKVVGPLWGARRAAGLEGRKILELAAPDGGRAFAVDGLGAGPGEWVLCGHGSRLRDLTVGADVADKDVVLAIVDDFDRPGPGGEA